MPFQSTVAAQQGFGVPGEMAFDSPYRAQPAVIRSTDPTLNQFGRAARIVAGATGSWALGSAGGGDPKALTVSMDVAAPAVFAGILVNPKAHALLGTAAGGSLAASMTIPNETNCELATEGDWVVSLAAAANPGDVVYYTIATGALVTAAPGAAIPGGAAGPIGTVERFVSNSANLAVLHLEPRVASLIP